MNLLSLENVTKCCREKNLFENITFGPDQGERIGLIGVNGIGKTTFPEDPTSGLKSWPAKARGAG